MKCRYSLTSITSRSTSSECMRPDVEGDLSNEAPAMRVEEVDPSSRFDNLEFSNVVTDGRALPLCTHYMCPVCSTVIAFTKQHLESRAERRLTILSPDLAAAMDSWAKERELDSRPFLDWLCPGCGLAARVYARPWAGGRHGDSGTSIVALVEHRADERP